MVRCDQPTFKFGGIQIFLMCSDCFLCVIWNHWNAKLNTHFSITLDIAKWLFLPRAQLWQSYELNYLTYLLTCFVNSTYMIGNCVCLSCWLDGNVEAACMFNSKLSHYLRFIQTSFVSIMKCYEDCKATSWRIYDGRVLRYNSMLANRLSVSKVCSHILPSLIHWQGIDTSGMS